METKRLEIERLEERQKNLLEEFKAGLGENNKWEEFLTKVFKKKIKRAKKKEQTGDGELNATMMAANYLELSSEWFE